MSKNGWAVSAPAAVALSGGTAKTVLQVVAASNHALAIKALDITFDGTSPTAQPVLVELVRQTTAGTMSSATPIKYPADDSDETTQMTAQHTATVEPTTTDVVRRYHVHPQLGRPIDFPFGEEIKVGGGDRLGIRITAPASVNCMPCITGEE